MHPLATGKVNYLEPDPSRVILISTAFEVYHALKIGLRETVDLACSCKRFGEVYRVSHKLIREKFMSCSGHLNGVSKHPSQSLDITRTMHGSPGPLLASTGTEPQFVNHTFLHCSSDVDDNLPYQANHQPLGRRRKRGGAPLPE